MNSWASANWHKMHEPDRSCNQSTPTAPGQDVARSFPGLDDEVTGLAQLIEKGNKKKKILVLTAAGAGVVAVLASLDSSSSSGRRTVSPSNPPN